MNAPFGRQVSVFVPQAEDKSSFGQPVRLIGIRRCGRKRHGLTDSELLARYVHSSSVWLPECHFGNGVEPGDPRVSKVGR